MSWVSGLIGVGVSPGLSRTEVRRVQTINVVALLAIVQNLVFSTTFFVLIDSSGSWTLRWINIAIVLAYVASIAVNAAHRPDAAMWLLNGTGLVNIAVSSLVLGLGLGSIAFFVIIPLTAILTSREDDITAPVVFAAGSVVGLAAVALADPSVPATVADTEWQTYVFIANVASVVLFATVVALYYRRRVDRAEAELAEQHALAEELLLNILPPETAERLTAGERVIADAAGDVSVLFVDLVGSTPLAASLEPGELVALLDDLFSALDDLTDRHGLEKVKTVGDAYIAVGGIPHPRADHLDAAAALAIDIRDEIHRHIVPGGGSLEARLGLHAGPVVAGVIGKRKFSYDIWGETVNIASRMESTGLPGAIQVTATVRDRLYDAFAFEPRGTVAIKGMGDMETYLLTGRRRSPS